MEKSPGAAPTSSPEEELAAAAAAEGGHAQHAEDASTVQEVEGEEATPVVVLKKGPWTAAEDAMLMDHVRRHGEGNWNAVQRMTGLLRCGKSCRLRWTNHLRPNLKKGSFSPDEELLIAQLHAQLGNRWARMAAHLPGRTDNEIKNYWNTRTKRRQRAGLPVYPPEVQLHLALSKRCRYDDFCSPLASSPQMSGTTNVQALGAAAAAASSAGYASSRPAPLDLARQLAVTSHQQQTVQFLSPAPFSAPSSPWAKPFARNAHYFQLAHSSPVSPSTPTGPPPMHPATPDLSLGYGVRGAADQQSSRLPPLSPSPGARAELPSNQYGRPTPPTSAAAAAGLGGGGALPDHQNAASLEKMLQELHDVIKVDPPALVPANGGGCGGAALERHDGGVPENGFSGVQHRVDDDMDTLFRLVHPAALSAPETVPPPAAASNHSGSTSQSQHSSDDQNPSTVDLHVAGGTTSSDQDWGLDGVCQWSNMSRIC